VAHVPESPGQNSLQVLDDAPGSQGNTGQCVSALCSSLYSTFASAGAKEALRQLPFLLADESAEARRLLDAMREAREKALDAAKRERSSAQGIGIGKIVGALSTMLLLLNPLK
jgi:hypothetical protein